MTGEAFICDAVRTPIGRYAGALSSVRADDLAAVPIAALMARHPGLDWQRLDDVILGCANQAGEDNRNVARMASLLAGLPVDIAGATVNRLCGSGLDAVAVAARAIKSGEGDFYIAGGVENMSRSPFVMPKAEAAFTRQAEIHDTTIGWRFVNPKMEDGLRRRSSGCHGRERGERASGDAGGSGCLRGAQPATGGAGAGGGPVRGRDRPGAGEAWPRDGRGHHDEHPRPETTLEQLGRLKPAFQSGGTVTAGNSSGVNDGAAAMLIASEDGREGARAQPRARVLGVATGGVPPRVMGLGPIPATRKLLARLGHRHRRDRRSSSSTRPSPPRASPCSGTWACPRMRSM